MARKINAGGLILGLLMICFALVPVLCAGDLVCKPRRARDEYPVWFMTAIVAPFVFAGIALVAQALQRKVLSVLGGLGVPLSFAMMIHALAFDGGANACDPGTIVLRLMVNHQWFPTSCNVWASLLGLALDSLFFGLMLESFRRGMLVSPWKERLEPCVKWFILPPLAPFILLFVPAFLLLAGRATLETLWRRIRS